MTIFAAGSLGLITACLFAADGSSAPAKPYGTIRFVGYNLHNYRLSPSEDGSTHAKPEREIQAMVRLLVELQPDVLGMCEIGAESDLADLQARLRAAGLDLSHSEWVQGADPVRHIALLSRFAIASRQSVRNAAYVLDKSTFSVQRGFLDVSLEVNSHYRLRLVGAHLKSQRDVAEGEQSLMRRYEAHVLRRHLDKILTENSAENLLVFGDFNETKDQPGVREVRGQAGTPLALRDVALGDSLHERWTYHYEPADEYSRIDYVFVSGSLLPEIRPETSFIFAPSYWHEASDHRALALTILPIDGKK